LCGRRAAQEVDAVGGVRLQLLSRAVSLRTASKRASGSDFETGSDKKTAESRFATPGAPDGERMFTGTTTR
jgi:hypothetical protein